MNLVATSSLSLTRMWPNKSSEWPDLGAHELGHTRFTNSAKSYMGSRVMFVHGINSNPKSMGFWPGLLTFAS